METNLNIEDMKKRISGGRTWDKYLKAIQTGEVPSVKPITEAIKNGTLNVESIKTIFDVQLENARNSRKKPIPTGMKDYDTLSQQLYEVETQSQAASVTNMQLLRMVGAIGGNSARRIVDAVVLAVSNPITFDKQEKINSLMNEYKENPEAASQKYDGVYKFDESGNPMKLNKFAKTWQKMKPRTIVRALLVVENQFMIGTANTGEVLSSIEPFSRYSLDVSAQIRADNDGFKFITVNKVVNKKQTLPAEEAWKYIQFLPKESLLNSVSEASRVIERAKSKNYHPMASVAAADVIIANITSFQSGSFSADMFDAATETELPSPDKAIIGIFRQNLGEFADGTEVAVIGSVAENKMTAPDGTVQNGVPKMFVWAVMPSPDPSKVIYAAAQKKEDGQADYYHDSEADKTIDRGKEYSTESEEDEELFPK